MKTIRRNFKNCTITGGFIALLTWVCVQTTLSSVQFARVDVAGNLTGTLTVPGLAGPLPAENPLVYGSNDLWLELTGITNGQAYLNLHHATNQVYEIWSKTNLLAAHWDIERELWPAANQEPTPFIVPQLARTSLFLWVRDWTGVDENANGIPDWWEYKYFGQLGVNPDADPDGDGFSNLQEYQAGTDPLNADSAPGLLGRWHFDDTNWLGAQAQVPLVATDVQLVPGWSSNAVELNYTDGNLRYRMVEEDGHTNLNVQCGTVRFWFYPNWSSVDQGGSGPGNWATLIQVYPDPAGWSLYANPDGTTLELIASTDGNPDYLNATASWEYGQWHQVAIVYSSTNTALYLDGAMAANLDGLATIPAGDEFTIGNDDYGDVAMGQFDELDTFDYPLSAERIARDYRVALNLPNLEIVSGNNQTGPAGSFLPQPLVVRATKYNSETMSNASITFTVTNGGAQLVATTNEPPVTNLALTTDTNGLVSVWIYFPTATNLLENIISVQATGTSVSTNANAYLDADGNGLPDWWEIQYFGTNGVDPNADPDGDGLSNLQEYQAGTDPHDYYNGVLPHLDVVSGNVQNGAPG